MHSRFVVVAIASLGLSCCLSFANPAKASVTVIDGAVIFTVGDPGDMGPPGGIDIDVPAGGAYGLAFSEGQTWVSFYWASTGPANVVGFYGPDNPNQVIGWFNGCDLAPGCGNPLDRQITWDFSNFPSGVTIV